jgi:hypothetical protein
MLFLRSRFCTGEAWEVPAQFPIGFRKLFLSEKCNKFKNYKFPKNFQKKHIKNGLWDVENPKQIILANF